MNNKQEKWDIPDLVPLQGSVLRTTNAQITMITFEPGDGSALFVHGLLFLVTTGTSTVEKSFFEEEGEDFIPPAKSVEGQGHAKHFEGTKKR